jgi:hypothetical protein
MYIIIPSTQLSSFHLIPSILFTTCFGLWGHLQVIHEYYHKNTELHLHPPYKEHQTQTKSGHTTCQMGATTNDPEKVNNPTI